MNRRPFSKPAITYKQQVERLRSRGMNIPDPARAAFYLQHLNYYRLGAYWLPFEADHGSHTFRPGTAFEAVLNLYVFDRELRLLVLDVIERIEVSVRAQWAYQIAHAYGPHEYLNPQLAQQEDRWQKDCEDLAREVERSKKEKFIQHFRTTYAEPLPPAWAACEVMSLGLLSRWYTNLKPMPTRRAIAQVYDLDEAVLQSWLRHLSYVRNVAAHHSRLWNREFTVTPSMPRKRPRSLVGEFKPGSRRLYNSLLIMLHLMDVIAPGHHLRARMQNVMEKYANVAPEKHMGFPTDWQTRDIWMEPNP